MSQKTAVSPGKTGKAALVSRPLARAAVRSLPEPDQSSRAQTGSGLGHDFGRVPVRMAAPLKIQPRLTTGIPGEKYEQETDRVAEQVVRTPDSPNAKHPDGPGTDPIRRLSLHAGAVPSASTPSTVHGALSSPGQPLDPGTRTFMESRFGHGLHQVRLHAGPEASSAAQSVQARAFAVGNHVVLGGGQLTPHTTGGKQLLAHELTHVLQRRRAGRTSAPGWDESHLEAEAHLAGLAAVRGRTYEVQGVDREDRPRFHPIFISTHGNQGFLNLAREFHIRWGYGTPTSASSIEEIVTQLAGGAGHIDRMTIVSHAVPDNINISFLRGGPGFVHESEWAVTTRQALPDYSGHATAVGVVNQVINDVRAGPPENAALLQRLSLDFTEPEERQFVWWLADVDFVRRVQPANAIPNRNQVRARAQQNANHYRERLRERFQAFAQFDVTAQPNDIDSLEQAINAVLPTYNWDPINAQTGRAIRDQILSGREAAVQRVLGQQYGLDVTEPFALALMFAQMRFDSGSTIEVKGCRIGQNPAYLEGISRFFGGGDRNPTVTAPDMFQIFGWMAARPHPDQTNRLRGLWNNANIRRAFVYWAGVFGWPLSDPPVADDLVNALRAGHAFPVGASLHYLVGHDPGNVAAWFARFGYHLAQAPDIEQAFFTGRTTVQGVQYTLVDWLQDARLGQNPGQFIFPPDPEYQNHIVSAQAGPAQALP